MAHVPSGSTALGHLSDHTRNNLGKRIKSGSSRRLLKVLFQKRYVVLETDLTLTSAISQELRVALAGLNGEVLYNCDLTVENESPASIYCALLHPHFGVALIDLQPDCLAGAVTRFQRKVQEDGEGFVAPHDLPVIYLTLSRDEVKQLPDVLSCAFDAVSRAVPPGSSWMATARRALSPKPGSPTPAVTAAVVPTGFGEIGATEPVQPVAPLGELPGSAQVREDLGASEPTTAGSTIRDGISDARPASPSGAGDLPSTDSAVWQLVADCSLSDDPARPARIRCAILHPQRGVALIDLLPDVLTNAVPLFRQRMQRSWGDHSATERLPVVHLALSKSELARLPEMLGHAFAATPHLDLHDTAWMAIARQALSPTSVPDMAGGQVGLALERPGQAGEAPGPDSGAAPPRRTEHAVASVPDMPSIRGDNVVAVAFGARRALQARGALVFMMLPLLLVGGGVLVSLQVLDQPHAALTHGAERVALTIGDASLNQRETAATMPSAIEDWSARVDALPSSDADIGRRSDVQHPETAEASPDLFGASRYRPDSSSNLAVASLPSNDAALQSPSTRTSDQSYTAAAPALAPTSPEQPLSPDASGIGTGSPTTSGALSGPMSEPISDTQPISTPVVGGDLSTASTSATAAALAMERWAPPEPGPAQLPPVPALIQPSPSLLTPNGRMIVPGLREAVARTSDTASDGAATEPRIAAVPAPESETGSAADRTPVVAAIHAAPSVETRAPDVPLPASSLLAALATPLAPARAGMPAAEADAARRAAVVTMHPDLVLALVRRGHSMFSAHDVSAARLFYERAAAAGSAEAAKAMGQSFDPAVLAGLGVRGLRSDRAQALSWYRRAMSLGDGEAEALARRLTEE